MPDLEFSVMAHSPTTAEDLRPILEKFEAQFHVKVNLRVFSWETGWTELVKFALYGHGPDVSEIGTTWASTLAATNALRPFGVRDIAAVGGRFAFLYPSWQSCYLSGEPEMWALPWLSNVRMVFYHRDLLRSAEQTAPLSFRSSDHLEQMLGQVYQQGKIAPLAIATHNTVNTLHNAAMWVWGRGSHFIDSQGKRILFNEPPARAGLLQYFGLYRYLTPETRALDDQQSDRLFLERKVALTLSDPGLLHAMTSDPKRLDAVANISIALPPGTPFVGGSNLVVWRHSRQQRLAFELVRFLTSQRIQIDYCQRARSLPVRLDALSSPPFSTEGLYQAIAEGLKSGQSYYISRLWGLVEEKLVAELNLIWAELFEETPVDLEAKLAEHLNPLAARLTQIISSGPR